MTQIEQQRGNEQLLQATAGAADTARRLAQAERRAADTERKLKASEDKVLSLAAGKNKLSSDLMQVRADLESSKKALAAEASKLELAASQGEALRSEVSVAHAATAD